MSQFALRVMDRQSTAKTFAHLPPLSGRAIHICLRFALAAGFAPHLNGHQDGLFCPSPAYE